MNAILTHPRYLALLLIATPVLVLAARVACQIVSVVVFTVLGEVVPTVVRSVLGT